MAHNVSEAFYFTLKEVDYRAEFNFSYKSWFYHNLTKSLFFGSQPDDKCKIPSVERAIECIEIYIQDMEEAEKFRKLSGTERIEYIKNSRG